MPSNSPSKFTHSAVGGRRKFAYLSTRQTPFLLSTLFILSSYVLFIENVVIHFLLRGTPILAYYDNIWISTVYAISNTSEIHARRTN